MNTKILVSSLNFTALTLDGEEIELSFHEIGKKITYDDVFYYDNGIGEPFACVLSSLSVMIPNLSESNGQKDMPLDNENTEIEVTPFSNGASDCMWRSQNCDECALGYNQETNKSLCELEEALALDALTLAQARQIGCSGFHKQENGNFVTLNARCSKFQCPKIRELYGDVSQTLSLFE